ncbi:uncharacterized protein LOC133845943 [Drosophila sulfurigaster albostrigata]|uniref:uncharacterized protein LOC133845943 n=1 Tax=Drosophila sulfurigaster albostrigata TaxID=89887 RepID=UPI002D21A197|nr:uncharacterized protein LOC133845943 [Drosophila sulfurigaster albostrigata]
MNNFETDSWDANETVALIATIKSIKDQHENGTRLRMDWQQVAQEMANCLSAHNQERSIPQLRQRYQKLRNDYFTARYRNRSCPYFNLLHDLFQNELSPEQDDSAEKEDEESQQPKHIEDDEMEQKYANTLQLELDDDSPNGTTGLAAKQPLRYKWAEGELEAFLHIITKLKLQTPLLRKRNAKVFKLIAREMAKRSFLKRPEQLRIKYHQLRRQYAKAKNGGEVFEHFAEMEALLNDSLQQPQQEESDEMDSDTVDSGEEEDGEAPLLATGSDSEGAVVASLPSSTRCKWTEQEVDIFLDTISSLGLQSALLRKRNAKIFKLLSKELSKRSIDKPAEKLRIKYQQLRRQYNKAKNGGESFEHFEAMHQLLNPKTEPQEANGEGNLSSGSESDFMDSDDNEADNTSRRGRHPDSYYWTDEEVDAFLSIIKQQNLFRALDGSKKRNFKILTYISNIMSKQSYKRTPHQLRNKLRLLMRRHREVQKDGLKNVRMLPRHYEMLDDLMQKKHTAKAVVSPQEDAIKALPKTAPNMEESDSDVSSSSSTCDLLRAAAESDDGEDALELASDPTPLEVLTSINEGQKQLMNMLTTSQENFLRQQREMQTQFLHQMSSIMRQEREATFQMLRELLHPK